MGKCRKCGKELTGIETTGWFGKLCEKCWQEQHYTQYPFKKGIDEKDKKIADLELKLAECEQEKLLNSYGMDRNADIAEDYKQQIADLEAELLKFAHRISDQNEEILELKQQLAEKDKEIEELKKQENKEKQSAGDIFVSMFKEFEKLDDYFDGDK